MNPYLEVIFVMKLERYLEIVPDPDTRIALSGCLERMFWEIASSVIWMEMQGAILDGRVILVETKKP